MLILVFNTLRNIFTVFLVEIKKRNLNVVEANRGMSYNNIHFKITLLNNKIKA